MEKQTQCNIVSVSHKESIINIIRFSLSFLFKVYPRLMKISYYACTNQSKAR